MKKTSLYLDDDLDRALALRAAEEGVTKAEFIRRALKGAAERPSRVKPLAVGIVHSRAARRTTPAKAASSMKAMRP